MFPSSANEFLVDTLGVVAANSNFLVLARGVGDILLQDSVSVTGQLNVSNLTASRLVATDGSKNLASTVTGANLNLSISDANAVFESRTLTGGVGIAAIGDLSSNRTITVDLDELATEATIDASTDFIAMVDATDSGSGKILLDNIPNGYVTETSIAAGDFISMVDITDSKGGKITFANLEGALAIENIGGTVPDDILGGTGITATAGANTIFGGDATIAVDLTDTFAWTGPHDFGGATSLEIPNGAGGTTVNAAGEITLDTTPLHGSLNYFDAAEESISPVITKTWGIESPAANDSTLGALRFPFAVTIDSVLCVLTSSGGASTDTVTINFKHSLQDRSELGPGAGGSGTKLFAADQTVNSNTTGNAFSTFADATIPINTLIAPYVVTKGGTVSELVINVYLTKDP